MRQLELRNPDRWVGIVCLVIAAVLLRETFGFRRVDWDPLGLPFWPRVLIGLLVAAGLYLIVRGRLDPEGEPAEPLHGGALLLLTGMLVYILALERLGFHVASAIFVMIFYMALAGPSLRHGLQAVLVAVLTVLTVWLAFERGMHLLLPAGELFPEAP